MRETHLDEKLRIEDVLPRNIEGAGYPFEALFTVGGLGIDQ
jgi:hypothetical protein